MNPQTIFRQGPRSRPRYALLVLAVVATGLLWRSRLLPLPPFAFKYGGDALWALAVFLGCGFLLRGTSTAKVALLALGLAWCVEFLQLYRAPWIEAIRATVPGRLVLGSTFNWPDLLAYAIGIVAGAVLEHLIRRPAPGCRSAERT